MSGKLPIDRVREAQDAPATCDEHRERFAQERAALQETHQVPEAQPPPRKAMEQQAPDQPEDAEEAEG